MATIDLNADLGEGAESDVELMGVVSSCNIACGGHAGDADSMRATIALALSNNVAIGAHPSYPDREGFGRRSHFSAGSDLAKSLINQIDMLNNLVMSMGQALRHVKPHGALYNDAAVDTELAEIVVLAAHAVCPNAAIVGPPGGALQSVATSMQANYLAEGFVDRAYAADGSLVARSEPNALHSDINNVTTQAVRLATAGEVTAESGDVLSLPVHTLCLHGDTDNAADLGRAVRDVLQQSGVEIRAVA